MTTGHATLHPATTTSLPPPEGPQSCPMTPIWLSLQRTDRLAVTLTLILISAVSFPQLAVGICASDGGDLQFASTVLGIMHPPGYAGFVSIGYLITRIPGVDPAYLVTVACHISMLIALALCMLMQIRFGVSPWIAGALVMALTSHWRVWRNLTEPEIYGPTLAVLTGATYLLLRYSALGRRRDVLIAAFLFGFAVANRPVIIWTFPLLAMGWWLARRRWEPSWRRTAATLAMATTLAAIPGMYQLGYLWVRDSEDAVYNYIANRNKESYDLPLSTEGPGAKWQRVVFHTTAREFELYMKYNWTHTRNRLVWIYKTFFIQRPFPLVSFACTILFLAPGVVLLFRRNGPGGLMILALAVGNVGFLCTYAIYGLAGDLMPLLIAVTVWAGVTLSMFFPQHPPPRRTAWAVCIALLVAIATVVDADSRRNPNARDPQDFLQQADVATLPANAVICSEWSESLPLRYAVRILNHRPDITVFVARPGNWLPFIERNPGRPVFLTKDAADFRDYVLTPFRESLWRFDGPKADKTKPVTGKVGSRDRLSGDWAIEDSNL